MKIEGKIVDVDEANPNTAKEDGDDEEPIKGFGEDGGFFFQNFIHRLGRFFVFSTRIARMFLFACCVFRITN